MSSFRTWMSHGAGTRYIQTKKYDVDDDDEEYLESVQRYWDVLKTQERRELQKTKEALAERDKLIETLLKPPEDAPPPPKDDDNRFCVVCMDRNKTHVFTECGHVCVCEDCSRLETCPLCRVKGKCIKVFI